MLLYCPSSTGHQRSLPNKDFHEGTEAGKVGPIWNKHSDTPILEVHNALLISGITYKVLCSVRLIQS